MEEEIIKNKDVNDFLQKYDQNDWNIVISKLSKIGLLSLEKDKPKKDFYTFNDFDNIIVDLEQKINQDDEIIKKKIKGNNLNIEDLNKLKEPDDNEEKEIIKDENTYQYNLNEKPNQINDDKEIEKPENKIANKKISNFEKNNSSLLNSNHNIPKYNYNNKFSSKYNPKRSYSNVIYRNNNFNEIDSKAKSNNYTYVRNCNNLNNHNFNMRNLNKNYNYRRNDFPCLNYNYSTSSPKIKNDKNCDPCCNKFMDYYNFYC